VIVNLVDRCCACERRGGGCSVGEGGTARLRCGRPSIRRGMVLVPLVPTKTQEMLLDGALVVAVNVTLLPTGIDASYGDTLTV